MKKILTIILAIAILTNIGTLVKAEDIRLTKAPEVQLYVVCDSKNYSKDVFCLTNQARLSKGLRTLKSSESLVEVSKQKSEDMCQENYFSHDYNGRSWTYFIKKSHIDYIKAGENLAKGYRTAPEATQALIDSPKHYENIIGDFTHLGVYTASCGGKNYTTQTFAKMAN